DWMSRTGVAWSAPFATSLTRPSFSPTSTRPSGRNAKLVGKLRPLTTVSSAKLGSTEPAACVPTDSADCAVEGRTGLAAVRAAGTGPPQTQPVFAWRAWDSSADRVAASGPRPLARASPADTSVAATDRPSGALTWYSRRLRASRTLDGSSW